MPQFVRSSFRLFRQNGRTKVHFSLFGRKFLPIFDKNGQTEAYHAAYVILIEKIFKKAQKFSGTCSLGRKVTLVSNETTRPEIYDSS